MKILKGLGILCVLFVLSSAIAFSANDQAGKEISKKNSSENNTSLLNTTKINSSQQSASKIVTPKHNGTKISKHRHNGSKNNTSQVNATKIDAPKLNATKINASQVNATKIDAPELNATKINASQLNISNTISEDNVTCINITTGTSTDSWEDAVQDAVDAFNSTGEGARGLHVLKLDAKLEDGEIAAYNATVLLDY
jgi:flavin-binding protein dodecin